MPRCQIEGLVAHAEAVRGPAATTNHAESRSIDTERRHDAELRAARAESALQASMEAIDAALQASKETKDLFMLLSREFQNTIVNVVNQR